MQPTISTATINAASIPAVSPSSGGAVFGERKIYYAPEAAEKAGREWVAKGS